MMPTIDISAIWNTLLTGFAVVFAVIWLFIHMSAVRDLRESQPKRFN